MIKELDTVVLNRDVPDHALAKGDVGTVVFCYPDHSSFEVEFLTAEGNTVALLTLPAADLRRPSDGDILNARPLRPA